MAQQFYHVANNSYQVGDDLCSYDEMMERGWDLPAYKWEGDADDYEDSGVVCMFRTRAEADAFAAEYGGKVLAISLPDNPREENIIMDTVSEGYPCVVGYIPAEYIK